MEILIRGAALALLLALPACELVREPTVVEPDPDQLLVHSVLTAGSDTVRVLLTRTGFARSPDDAIVPVSGARVRIAGGGTEAVLREAPDGFPRCLVPRSSGDPSPPSVVAGPGCYAAVFPGGVRAGERYALRVELPDGGEASGETVIPEAPEPVGSTPPARVCAQWNGFAAAADSLSLRWKAGANTARVGVTAVADEVYLGGAADPEARCAVFLLSPDRALIDGPDDPAEISLELTVEIVNCERGPTPSTRVPVRPDSIAVAFLLTAYDSAFVRYTGGRGDGTSVARASAGITGAYGVLGSAATARRRILFVVEDPF